MPQRHLRNQVSFAVVNFGSGGIYCSMHDLALLAKGVINSYHGQSPSLLTSATMQEVFTIQNGEADYVIGKNKRGLGWYLFENKGKLAINHTGSAGYAFAHLMIFPKDKAALMIFTNSRNGRDLAENAGYNMLKDFQLEIADVFLQPLIQEKEEPSDEPVQVAKATLEAYVGNYSETISYSKVLLEKDTLKISRNNQVFPLVPKTSNSFAPLDSSGKEIKNIRYYFQDIGPFPSLVLKTDRGERVLGYKFNPVKPEKWGDKIGFYEHFGYQMRAGDMKFKGIELKITEDNVLIAVLSALDNVQYALPIDVISNQYGKTAGLLSGYGMTLTFSENEKYHLLDFSGITFRKAK
ncbi:MAG: serine hydrolase [Bacteroidota bacterium]